MTKKQLVLLITGLIIVSGALLVGSWFLQQRNSTPKQSTEPAYESVELASMEVYPEKTEESLEGYSEPTISHRTDSASTDNAAQEKASKTRNELVYGTERDPAEWESYKGPEFDFDSRPSITGTGLPPTITGITDEICDAVDGYEYRLIDLAEIEAYRAKPTASECRIEIFQKEENGVVFSLSVEEQVIGFILYDKAKGTLEGGTETFQIKD